MLRLSRTSWRSAPVAFKEYHLRQRRAHVPRLDIINDSVHLLGQSALLFVVGTSRLLLQGIDGIPQAPAAKGIKYHLVQRYLRCRRGEERRVRVGRRDGREVWWKVLSFSSVQLTSSSLGRWHTFSTALPTPPRPAYQPFSPFSTSFFALTTCFCRSETTAVGSSPSCIRWRARANCSSSSTVRGPEAEVDGEDDRPSSAESAAAISDVICVGLG